MKTEVIEINEAINAGNDLLNEINNTLSHLDSASLWGVIDLFSDSGFLTSILKHSSLHKAQDGKQRLAYLIDRFNKELDDVKIINNVEDMALNGGLEFCDWFFDGLIIDAYTLSRIHESKGQLLDVKDKVISVLNDLQKLKDMGGNL